MEVDQPTQIVVGLIADMEDGVARLLIGPEQEEWWFPTTMLPVHVKAGDRLDFEPVASRYLVLGPTVSDDEAHHRSIDDRLSRPLNARRTGQVDAAELRRQIRG